MLSKQNIVHAHLHWLLPFPGDWHIMFNYQKVLMKLYCDAGLKQLGEISGHRAETLTSLIQCNHFRRTHNLLSQVAQAFYQFFLTLYTARPEISEALQMINTTLTSVIDAFASVSTEEEVNDFSIAANDKFSKIPITFDTFHSFLRKLSTKQDTIKFWYQFVFEDCLTYLAMYISLRTRDWGLRTASIKLMAPLFEALDRQIYQRLIPRHLMELEKMPAEVLYELVNGGFTVRLCAIEMHRVALDECHEMKINKDAKMAVVRPSVEKMEHMSHSLQFTANCINNFKHQLFPEKRKAKNLYKPTRKDKVPDTNTKVMKQAIEKHGMYQSEVVNKGLWNFF